MTPEYLVTDKEESTDVSIVRGQPVGGAGEPPADETPRERKQRLKLERKLEKEAELDAKLARYQQLRANVRRRRFLYGLFIFLDIVVIAATVWDIAFNGSDYQWYLLPCYVVLFIFGLLLLISRR
ncbi:MAG: hypothetical protein QOJ26_868, partial [Thermoplasmata archaeon]|nr:hypothetical protein [Thermoplasmata archaeon]